MNETEVIQYHGPSRIHTAALMNDPKPTPIIRSHSGDSKKMKPTLWSICYPSVTNGRLQFREGDFPEFGEKPVRIAINAMSSELWPVFTQYTCVKASHPEVTVSFGIIDILAAMDERSLIVRIQTGPPKMAAQMSSIINMKNSDTLVVRGVGVPRVSENDKGVSEIKELAWENLILKLTNSGLYVHLDPVV